MSWALAYIGCGILFAIGADVELKRNPPNGWFLDPPSTVDRIVTAFCCGVVWLPILIVNILIRCVEQIERWGC